MQHGFGHAAQNVDFFLAQVSAVRQRVQAGHEFFGGCGVKVANVHQGLLPVRQQATYGACVGHRGGLGSTRYCKAAQCLPPFVGDQLHGAGQVERAKLRVSRNAERRVAAVHVVVGHAKAL